MRKKTIEELDAGGYKILNRDKILSQKSKLADNKTLRLIADSMDGIKKAIDKVAASSESDHMETLLNTHFSLVKRLFDKVEKPEIKSLTFERNKNGLISKALIHRGEK